MNSDSGFLRRCIVFLLCLLLAASTLSGCRPTLRRETIRLGDTELVVEIADTPELRQRGLMHRRSLPENRGMLFVFDREEPRSFWMKNTRIPLSIAYIGTDGTIKSILDMEPFDLRSHPSGRSVRYALEVNQGYFERHGIGVGDRVEIPESCR